MDKKWKFKDSPETAVITTRNIVDRSELIEYVTHDAIDGSWQFLPNSKNFLNSGDAFVISFTEILALDPTLEELTDLPLGWHAWRNRKNSTWEKAKNTE